MIYLTNIDLNQNELQNAVIQPLAAAPANPKLGQIYCNSGSSKILWWDGSGWKTIGVVVEASAANGKIRVDGVDMTVYELPIASSSVLGGIKVGAGFSIDADGVLSIPMDSSPTSGSAKPVTSGGVHTALAGKAASTHSHPKSQITDFPTNLSAFTNDEGFIKSTVDNLTNYYTKSSTYTKSEVDTLLGGLALITISVVQQLPATGETNVIYLAPKTPAGSTPNVYEEWIWVAAENRFEKIGDTAIDLSNYLQKTGDGSNVTAAFSTAGTRANIATGEKLSVIFGKLAKWFTDLKAVAFSGSYNDLSNKPTLAKSATLTLSTAETTKSMTLTGSAVLSVTVVDSVTKDVVLCDVDINGMTVTISTSVAPANALTATISYL